MCSIFELLASLVTYLTTIKGQFMEGRIDSIDVKNEQEELIALYYYMELKAMAQVLLYEQIAIVRSE